MWYNTKNKLPEEGKFVICWDGTSYYFCRYKKLLTWKMKRELAFVNILSNGFSVDDITHWMYLPEPPKDDNAN